MKLTIKCISVSGKKSTAEIVVQVPDTTTILELKELIVLENWLNEHTNAKFIFNIEGE